MIRIFLVFLAIGLPLLVASEDCNIRQFFEFKYKYNKIYEHAFEEHRRCAIFTKKLNEINKRSKVLLAAKISFMEGINEFSDLTKDEFRKQYTGLARSNETMNPITDKKEISKTLFKILPENWDSGYDELDLRVPQIHAKNQKPCGACWAFTATGVYEYYLYKKFGFVYDLSEQMSVDCVKKFACTTGGQSWEAFNYFLNNGVDFTSVYPWVGVDKKCNYRDTSDPANGLSKNFATQWHAAPSDETYLAYMLEAVGWISVTISADPIEHYQSGIIPGSHCHGEVNHAVILVGYGTDQKTGTKYWILRNSWGPHWGEEGYFRIERGVNACEIANNYDNERTYLE
ncbi:hypothetical protein PVAND_010646 [Polypedilum vanderplanki]|uniref:Uncharacterized protein n=1 Tax=Polypedilum vanderplanki TaxID=319348 RepID=A0A9J6CGX8_POLVA|nr:hypothetical protein PVAND_010646 [Polypedilum vanderplanki]